MSDIYSNLKPAWWYLREGGFPARPKQIQLILSDLCNQNCHFCAYRMDGYSSNQLFTQGAELAGYGHNNPKRFLPTEKALEIISDAAQLGVLGIQFTGGGEPTVHPDHEAIFQHALERGLKCALVSNGLRWSDSLIPLLRQFAWVRVSVDAGTPETYARTRDTAPRNFDKVWGNVKRLAAEIRSGTPADCTLGIGYVVTPDNRDEIHGGVNLAKESGAAYIRLSAMFSPEGAAPYRDHYADIRESIHEARALYESGTFKVHDLFGDRVEDLEQGSPDYNLCSYQHYNTYIGADANMYRCCVLAYNQRGIIGSVRDKTFGEAWRDAGDALEHFDARGCERCQFNERNKAMAYLVTEKPPHKEFP